MTAANSFTDLLNRLKLGDHAAAANLWEQYFPKLVRVARERFPAGSRRVSDEEDAALSALNSFCRAVQNDRFPQLVDRDGLWRLPFQMTVRKVIDRLRYDGRAIRQGADGGQFIADNRTNDELLAEAIGESPTPEFLAVMNEEHEQLFRLLGDDQLRALVSARLEGSTNREIAEQLDCSLRTVERRLELVRKKWEKELS